MCRTSSGLAEYNQQQIAEMLSPENVYYASQALGRPATPDEAGMHYVLHGGPVDFHRRWTKAHALTSRTSS